MSKDKNNESAMGIFTMTAGEDALLIVNADIVDYKKAAPAQKERMDQLVTRINEAIVSGEFTAINSLDKEPSDKLGATSEGILRGAQNAGAFLGGFTNFREKIAAFDFDAVGKMAADYSAGIQRKMALAALSFGKSPFMYVIKRVAYFFTGMGSKNSTMDDLRHEIDKSMLQFGEVIADLEGAKDKIPEAARNLVTQERARMEAYSEYGLYIGAAREAYRQWKEEEIPALQDKAASSGSQKDAYDVQAQILGMTVLNKKVTAMNTFHKSCLVQLETINDLKQALALSEQNIETHLTTSKGQWLAFMAEASSAATISAIAEANQTADQFGQRVFEQSITLSDMTREMSRACFEGGALDAAKMVELLKKKAADAVEGIKFVERANAGFEAKNAALDAAARQLQLAKAEALSPKVAQEAQKLLAYSPEQGLDLPGAESKDKVPVQKPAPKQP